MTVRPTKRLGQLTRHFDLTRTDMLHVSEIATEPVRAVYMSNVDRRLLVLDKESNGRKADALNAALNAASSPFRVRHRCRRHSRERTPCCVLWRRC